MTFKEHFIASLIEELAHLNGTDFEKLCKVIFCWNINHEVEQKGHNQYMKPVKGAVDFIQSDSIGIVGQSGTDKDYFTSDEKQISKSKPVKDIEGSIKNDPNCKVIYLYANRRQTGNQEVILREYIDSQYTQEVHVYDSERIANGIYDHIEYSDKIDIVLTDLPKSREYYDVMPKAHQIPQFNGAYYERKEYLDVVELLSKHDVIQITGLSGIGKTEIAKSIARHQSANYDTVLWIDGTNFDGNIKFVPIIRNANNINLGYILEIGKVLVVVDNLNQNQFTFIDNFNKANKNGSKCVITTLDPDKSYNTFNLSNLTEDVSKEILTTGLDKQKQPNDKQLNIILKKVCGYSLILKLIRKNIECNEYTWTEILDSLSDITSMDDTETHQEVACRLIGRYIESNISEFRLLNNMQNTQVSKGFFDRSSNAHHRKHLCNLSILQESQHYYSVHQIILDSIRTLLRGNLMESSSYELLGRYLRDCVEDKPIGVYDLLFRNKEFVYKALNECESPVTRKVIVYSILQTEDTYTKPYEYIQLINTYLDDTSMQLYDILLFIERTELDLYCHKGDQNYCGLALQYAEDLSKKILPGLDHQVESVLLHHVGKLYGRARCHEKTEQTFLKLLKIERNASYALLQLGRLYNHQKNMVGVRDCINKIFELGEDNLSLSILLSSYELIESSELEDLKAKYILNRVDIFTKKLLYAISIDNNQVAGTISYLSSFLQYKLRNTFLLLMDALPIVVVEKHKKAFEQAQLRFFQYKSFEDKSSDEAKRIYSIAYNYFSLTPLELDFERKRLSDLYLEAGLFKEVLRMEDTFDNPEDVFYCMNRAKAFHGLGNYHEALKNIDISLRDKNQKEHFQSAFHHCKAQILYAMKDTTCFNEMSIAIGLLGDRGTIELYENERSSWTL